MSNGQYPPPPPGAAAAKPGLPGWAKIAIGCGCLLLLIGAGVVGFMVWGARKAFEIASDPARMAEFVLEQDPNLEVVENNADDGTLTVRNKKTGETTTFNYADIKQGKFSIEGKDGKTVDIDAKPSEDGQGGGMTFTGPDGQKVEFGAGAASDVPSWVPLYPSAKETTSAFRTEAGNELTGLVTQSTGDDMAKVKKYYEDYFPRNGYKITATFSAGSGGQQGTIMNAEKGGTTVAVTLGGSDGKTSVNITYKGPK